MAEEMLISEISKGVGTLKFNRPERRNALSPALLAELSVTLKQWAKDERVRVLVITGNSDKAFSSGYDIAEIPTELSPNASEILKTENPLELALDSIKNFPYPVIAMMNGYCFGAAMNLAICCDIRIGVEHMKAGMPPAKLGLVYPPDGLRQFVEVLGMARTRQIFFTGHTYSGQEVLEMGLVDRLVPAGELSSTVYAMAKEISENAPLSLKGTKKILNMIGKFCLIDPAQMDEARSLVAEAFSSEDLREGQTAFIEKRSPVFKGF